MFIHVLREKNNHESFAYSRSIKIFVHFRARRYMRLTACVSFYPITVCSTSDKLKTASDSHDSVVNGESSVSLLSVIGVSSADDSVLV